MAWTIIWFKTLYAFNNLIGLYTLNGEHITVNLYWNFQNSNGALNRFVLTRTGTVQEDLEKTHFHSTKVNVLNYLKGLFERRTTRRPLQWEYILRNSNNYLVNSLWDRLQTNNISIKNFVEKIAIPYSMLSKVIYWSVSVFGEINLISLTVDQHVNQQI